jgi:Tfp pilus assembly protein PilE
MIAHRRSGTTIVELITALVVIGVLVLLASTSFSNARDVLAVRGARDAVIAASARARAFAVAHGGASLVIDAAAGKLRITTRDRVIDESSDVTSAVGVGIELDASHSVSSVALAYDALGIGRLASRTITLRRERAVAGVTFSAYGRPRAW